MSVFTCAASDTGEPNAPFLIRRKGTGTPDGMAGYTDAAEETVSFCGRHRRIKRNIDPTYTGNQGTTGVVSNFLFTDRTNLDVRESDVIVEARDDGSGHGTLEELPNGKRFRVKEVRIYDDEMQIDVNYVQRDLG